MRTIIATALVTVAIAVLALSASAQTSQCPEGYHYDNNQQKCVKHGN
jgi:hypothetical protein